MDDPAERPYLKEVVVEVNLVAKGPIGPLRADVVLETNAPDARTVVLTVAGYIVDDIETSPRVLTLPQRKPGQPFSLEFELRSRTVKDFAIFDTKLESEKIENPGVILKPALGTLASSYGVRITGVTAAAPGPIDALLRVTLEDDRTILLPIWGYLESAPAAGTGN